MVIILADIETAMESDYLTTKELAALRRTSAKALAVERCLRRDHPPYIRIGRKILYERAAVLAWLAAHEVPAPNGTARRMGA